jgi:SUKH superfamily protein
MWRQLVEGACSDCSFSPPASETAINDVEAALGVQVPEDLRGLWLEANGIRDRFGDGIWSVEEVVGRNLDLRSHPEQNDLYMSFDSLFCFAGAGNGDLFFLPIQADGRINRPDVFAWNHEIDSREWVAGNLQQFVERWFRGELVR